MDAYRTTAEQLRAWLRGAEQAELLTSPLDLPQDQPAAYHAGYEYVREKFIEPYIATGRKPKIGFLGTPFMMDDSRRMARDNELFDVPAMKLATDFIADRIAAYEAAQ